MFQLKLQEFEFTRKLIENIFFIILTQKSKSYDLDFFFVSETPGHMAVPRRSRAGRGTAT